MSEQLMSRRKFLVRAGTVLGAASASGLILAAERPSRATAATGSSVPLPWPYTQLDPDALARRAYEVYFASGCAEATWWPIVEALAPNYPDTWGTIPRNMFKFGAGGVDLWGTICGTLNGSCAILGMVGAPTTIADALMEYYANTPLPTNRAYLDMQAGWTPAAPARKPLDNVPSSTSHSQLCHVSLSQWAMTAGNAGQDTTLDAIGMPGQKDRCGKLCFDMTHKTIEMLNAYFATHTLPADQFDPTVPLCKSCHSVNAMGNMACGSCHDEKPTHAMGSYSY